MNLFQNMKIKNWQQTAYNSLVSNNYAKAEAYFRKLYELQPNVQGHAFNLAVSLMGLKRFSEAESLFLEDIEQFGSTFSRCRSLGDLHYLWGNPEKTAHWYKKALKEDGDDRDKRMLRKRIEKCSDSEAFRKVQESHEWFDRGSSLSAEGNYDEATDAFRTAAELDETNIPALNNVGSLLFRKGAYEAAVQVFDEAMKISAMPALEINRENARKALEKKQGQSAGNEGFTGIGHALMKQLLNRKKR